MVYNLKKLKLKPRIVARRYFREFDFEKIYIQTKIDTYLKRT